MIYHPFLHRSPIIQQLYPTTLVPNHPFLGPRSSFLPSFAHSFLFSLKNKKTHSERTLPDFTIPDDLYTGHSKPGTRRKDEGNA